MNKVLISGVSGFVGSHLLDHILVNTDWDVIGIASWQHKGCPTRITDSKHYQDHKERVTIITHDLSSCFTDNLISRIGNVDYIFNLASESHVNRSIQDPVPFIENNVKVALSMLELARKLSPQLFLQFSTDEVYGAAPVGVDFKEWDTILPSNPYAASKAAQEAIAISYWRTYGVPVVITNCMNIFGERQDKEKYVAKTIKAIQNGDTLTIHGSVGNIGSRFYLHARNIADAVVWIANNITPAKYGDGSDRPDRYHIAGEREIDNLSLAQMIAEMMGKELKYTLEDFHSTRPGHDRRYALDGSKLKEAGWKQPQNLEESLRNTILWETQK
jgi:dTDP-glucose 4,6-dehydratase